MTTSVQPGTLDPRPAGEWRGVDLGTRTVSYTERDAILYALAVGAPATDLELVLEDRLRVLPTFALTLAQWAPDALGSQGGFDTLRSVHGSQHMRVRKALPRNGELTMSATVAEVWDKGAAAVFDIRVESDYFEATWSIFAPGSGGFGGDRGPAKQPAPQGEPNRSLVASTFETQAALYRLLGDHHHIHIDPEAAAEIGQPRPIMHGLCTLAAATLPLAAAVGAHPADLVELSGRFAAPAFPGDQLAVDAWDEAPGAMAFEVRSAQASVISGGHAVFG
ncbi:enoyl-CoA hydratase [Rhodococcus sp. D2-41]|uniref:MaoC/PaaZ C-terminal domain-containing protein n=1 Tax=Speluncibacter jeojiensis TaxID=2710754 RepID=A0A9X4RHE1_9ACTN|nr:MaoC/PaaZ C-terminal domain-containing protein [Rhodococcus sp. D2-41]MDG3011669.1 enoyl-CoA hydratase [Rhodococcus sp. D2-41]MDG3014976.1 MaoC/PaaZ C-terminal domain-containing protein [Corynebacteriales bacterium D3-21]